MRSSRLAASAVSLLLAANGFATLVGYWNFDEGVGTSLTDHSGYGHAGWLVNEQPNTWILGPSSGALYFDGTVGPTCTRVEIGDSLLLRLSNSVTFAAWIRCDNISRDAPILAKEGPGGALSYWFGVFGPSGAGNWGGLFDQDGWQTWDFGGRYQGAVPQGQWVHVAMTWNGSQVQYYKNGTPTNSLSWGGVIHPSNARLFIGSNSEYTFESNRTAFQGAVDEVHVYDHAIPAADVSRLATAVTGHVDLSDFLAPPAGQIIWVDFIQEDEIRDTKMTTLDEAGNYFVHTEVLGVTTVRVKPTHWLSRVIGTYVLGGQTGVAGIVVVNGDCDRDNEIGIGDYALLSAAYGSERGGPNWNIDADLNGDDAVDIADYAILSYSYGQVGDQ